MNPNNPAAGEFPGRARLDLAATEPTMTDRERLRRLRDIVALTLAFAVVLGTTLLARSDTSRIEDARSPARSVSLGPT
jgi:hypothetical protein